MHFDSSYMMFADCNFDSNKFVFITLCSKGVTWLIWISYECYKESLLLLVYHFCPFMGLFGVFFQMIAYVDTFSWTEKLVDEQRKFDAVVALEVCSLWANTSLSLSLSPTVSTGCWKSAIIMIFFSSLPWLMVLSLLLRETLWPIQVT